MGREVKRVPLAFDWPLNEVWSGYLSPDKFAPVPCSACDGQGWSPDARRLYDVWYGRVPFKPEDNGCLPLRPDTPAVRAFAERNIAQAPEFYGTGEIAIVREACRLAALWNGQWRHHLSQVDVDALLEAGRLRDFTHRWTRADGWQPREPAVRPTAAQVNEWSLRSFGHDSCNAWAVIDARCDRYRASKLCGTCAGEGSFEAYPGQRAEAEAWEETEPPEGDGWQLWQTVSEGSPISPVFGSAEELARWMASPAYTWGAADGRLSYAAALNFVRAGWAPTAIGTAEGLVSGVEYVGHHAAGGPA